MICECTLQDCVPKDGCLSYWDTGKCKHQQIPVTKTYRKDGNTKTTGKTYCKEHFIEKYKREPNILDTAHFYSCDSIDHCERRNAFNKICGGILRLTNKYRQDNQSVEEWACQTCGTIVHRR